MMNCMKWTGKTLKYNNGEFCESTHSTLRKEEGASNFKVTKALGTPYTSTEEFAILSLA